MRAAALGLGVLAALAAAASPAAAATIVTGTGCYPTGGDISVAGQGFAPGSLVTVTGSGVEGRAFADSSGNVQVMAAGQPISTRVPIARAITLTASDGAAAAQTTVRVTNFTFSIAPAVRHPDTPVRWRVSGFAPRDRVYAHYVHAGRERRRVLLGRMPFPCSILRAQVPMLPIQHPARGRWTIQLDASPRYHADTSPRLRLAGTIRRR